MVKTFGFFSVLLAAASAWATAPHDEPIVKAVEKVRPAVVNIFTERIVLQEVRDPRDVFFERYFGGGMARGNKILATPVRNLGSGAIVSPNGYIVTNQHVVDRAEKLKIKVTLANGEDKEAILLRDDDLLDLALIKIESPEPLPYLNMEKLSPNLMLGERSTSKSFLRKFQTALRTLKAHDFVRTEADGYGRGSTKRLHVLS